MRLGVALLASVLATGVTAGVIDPASPRDVDTIDTEPRSELLEDDNELWKRRGGGGGGRGGGGGGRGGSGGRGGGSRGSAGSSGSSRPTNTYTNSNSGGYSNGGSGIQPRFVGGTYYGGGGRVPFPAGASRGGITPYPVYGGLGFWPGYYAPYPVYFYPYSYHHTYHNETSDEDEDRPVVCVCTEYEVCSCEEIDDDDDAEEFFEELIGDGDYAKLNNTVVTVAEVNGTTTIFINGTLPNGTTVHSDNPDDYAQFMEDAAIRLGQGLGMWPLAVAIGAAMLIG